MSRCQRPLGAVVGLLLVAVGLWLAPASAQGRTYQLKAGRPLSLPSSRTPSDVVLRFVGCGARAQVRVRQGGRSSRLAVRSRAMRVDRGAPIALRLVSPGTGVRCRVSVTVRPHAAPAAPTGATVTRRTDAEASPAATVDELPSSTDVRDVRPPTPAAPAVTPAVAPAPASTTPPVSAIVAPQPQATSPEAAPVTGPTGTTQPSAATTVTQPTAPAEPSPPTEPTTPSEPTTPTPPDEPTTPTAPTMPASPTTPAPGPVAPTSAVRLGAAVDWARLVSPDRRYADALAEHFTSVTAENVMKMDHIHPRPDDYYFSPADDLVDFARAHGEVVRGHTLVWDQQIPSWVTSRDWTRDELIAVMQDHIRTVVGHFKGRVASWDVVNEPLNDDGTLRQSLWERVIGPDYIDIALRAAHSADPDAKLFINDYSLEFEWPKTDAMLSLLRTLKSQGAPVDGIGTQMHMYWWFDGSADSITRIFRRFADLGLEINVTEMDVSMDGSPLSGDQRDAAQASIYGMVGAACARVSACTSITTWGVTDSSSWRGASATALAFADDYSAKPAWSALLGGLATR